MSWARGLVGPLALSITAVSFDVAAQEPEARVVRSRVAGSFAVRIGDKEFWAITDSMERVFVARESLVRELRAEVAILRDSIQAKTKAALLVADSTIADAMSYIGHLEDLNRGWRDLAGRYRRLAGEPWLTFEGGAGATGGDRSPALMMGLGIRRIRLWGFFQERNSGGFLGVSLRLY